MNILNPDLTMLVLTWVTFFVLLVVLKKFAWKPIVDGLQKREDHIRRSLQDADAAMKHLQEIQQEKARILQEARQKAQGIVEDSRKSAAQIAKHIDQKAKAEAQQTMDNARQQIEAQREGVRRALKQESAAIAVALASRIIKENLDNDKSRRLVRDALKEIT